jgi:putative flippase GtrA
MKTAALRRDALPAIPSMPSPVLDVVIPVHNEEAGLETCLRRLHAHLTTACPYSFRITVAENASSDGTVAVARQMAAELSSIDVLVLRAPGRGRALRTAWLASDSPVLVYMDVDLSTDLAALLPLVAPLVSGHSDLAIGTRLTPSSRVVRGLKREVVSRSYNLLLRGTRTTSASDAQCGFKAIRADVAERLLPLVEDDGWFFDTELLWLAERVGLRIHEVPVDWVDDPDSRVDIVATARADLAGIVRVHRTVVAGRLPIVDLRARIGRGPLTGSTPGTLGQLARFMVVGAFSTAAYLLLFLLLRGMGSAEAANLGALLCTAVANTAVNRRLTFKVRGRRGAARAHVQGLLVFAVGLVMTGGALAALQAVQPHPSRPLEASVLVAASLVATMVRFVLFRGWVFRAAPPRQPMSAPAAVPIPAVVAL